MASIDSVNAGLRPRDQRPVADWRQTRALGADMSLPAELIRAVVRHLEPQLVVGGLAGVPIDAAAGASSFVTGPFDRRFGAPMHRYSASLQALVLVSKAGTA